MWYFFAILNLALPVAASSKRCKGKSIFDDNVTKCIVEDRTDLPSFHDEAQYEVFFCSHPVHGTGSIAFSEMMGLIHSSIGLKECSGNGSTVYTLEFWALHFNPKGLLIPAIENGTFKWSSEAIVTWAPMMSKKVWTNQVSLGFTSGKILSQFMDWVPKWHQSHRYYQMFSVWDGPELGADLQRYLNATTCDTFTEDGLAELHRLGAPLASEEVLCRTYVVMNTAGPLQPVGLFSPKRVEMLAYYDSLGTIFGEFENMTLRKTLELVGVTLMEKAEPFAFIYDRDSQKYYKAALRRPYLEPWPMYLSQRMVLPWQPQKDALTKECDPWGQAHESSVMV
jgi:hypothetical protein